MVSDLVIRAWGAFEDEGIGNSSGSGQSLHFTGHPSDCKLDVWDLML